MSKERRCGGLLVCRGVDGAGAAPHDGIRTMAFKGGVGGESRDGTELIADLSLCVCFLQKKGGESMACTASKQP